MLIPTQVDVENRWHDDSQIIDIKFIGKNVDYRGLLYRKDWDDIFPSNSVVKCRHCGQWGARKCECKYCGAPID